MSTYNVWASCYDAAITVCENASLQPSRHDETVNPPGTYGQAGWDIGINFTDCNDLVVKLRDRRIYRQEISRFAVNAHGTSGAFHINGDVQASQLESSGNIDAGLIVESGWTYRNLYDTSVITQIRNIGHFLGRNSMFLMMGCISAQGPDGTHLLRALSLLWPNVRVVGFVVIGIQNGARQSRQGEHCAEPGMRLTNRTSPSLRGAVRIDDIEARNQRGDDRLWMNLQDRPWADENARQAKIALNGAIIRDPENH